MEPLEQVWALVLPGKSPIEVQGRSFWVDDVETEPGQHTLTVSLKNRKNWLKFKQAHHDTTLVCPVDGPQGIFACQKGKLPIAPHFNDDKFSYEKTSEQGDDVKNAGDCDALVVNKECHLLEFKTNEKTDSDKQQKNNSDKAEAQLARSLAYFKDIKKVPVSACFVVVPYSPPRFRANYGPRQLAFLKNYNTKLIYTHTQAEIEL
jgi:hypothetical protein